MSVDESTVEAAAREWLGELGYAVGHGPHLAPGEPAAERDGFGDVVLIGRLRAAIARLNPHIPEDAREDALKKVLRVATPSLVGTNRLFHVMLRDGVSVEYRRKDGSITYDHARLLNFDRPDANDWFAVNQFTVVEGPINRRPDIVVFVNGLPLGVLELKNAAEEDATTFDAFKDLQLYKEQIPTVFHCNAVIVASDGTDARIGILSADWERMMPWRTIDGEALAPAALSQLEVLLRGAFDRRRFLDLLRHFIVFEEDPDTGALIKKVAGYHQFHAVNTALAETIRAAVDFPPLAAETPGGYFAKPQADGTAGDRRVGVVWHISILSDQFLAEVRGMPQKNLAVELLRKLLGGEIKLRSRKFLIQSKSFAAMLEVAIRKYQNRTIEAAAVIEELIKLAKDMRTADQRGEELGLTEEERAFYDALADNQSAVEAMGDEKLRVIATELVNQVRKSVTIDWTLREGARAKIRVMVKRILNRYGYPPDLQEEAVKTVLAQATLLCADWTT